MLLGVVVEIVIIRFVGDEDVFGEPQARRRVERAGHDAEMVAVDGPPEEIASADAAKPSLGALRGAVPAKAVVALERDVLQAAIGGGDEIAAGAPALRAVAGDDGAKLAANFVTHAAAQASPFGVLQRHLPFSRSEDTELIFDRARRASWSHPAGVS